MKIGLMRICLTMLVALIPDAAGEQVSTWVDENGVTHFSNRQFAPADAQAITVGPANGMVKPTGPAPASSSASRGPRVSTISLPPKRNPKGWRNKGESIYTGRKHQPRRPGR